MRTEHAAHALQTRVRFLLREDGAINPRYAPQGQHGSGSHFCFLTVFSPLLRCQLRTSHRQLLPQNSLLYPQAAVARILPFSATFSICLLSPHTCHFRISSRCSYLSLGLVPISFASFITHARLAWTGK